MHIRLRSNKDLPDGIDQILRTFNIESVSFPDNLDFSIYKDQVVDLYFNIIPLPINAVTGFTFQFFSDINNKRESERYQLELGMIFNNDGSLRFINDQSFSNDEKYIPTKFKGNKIKNHTFEIYKEKDSKVKKIR